MKTQNGFVLLDVIVGGLILSIGLTCLLELSLAARRAVHISQWKEKAVNLAQSELEEIKGMGVDQAISSARVLPGQTVESLSENGLRLQVSGNWLVDNSDLLALKVSVLWSYGPGGGTVPLETMVSRK